jgi:ABC-type glycerol-3-phosphate transport system substrate-binding protein
MNTSLAKKLKLKEAQTIVALNTPATYPGMLGNLPKDITIIKKIEADADQIHLFVTNKGELDKHAKAALQALSHTGIIWVAYPKKTSKMQTDLSRDQGWEDFLAITPLQGIALIAIDDTWSAVAFRKVENDGLIKTLAPAPNKTQNDYIDMVNRTVMVPAELQQLFKQHPAAADFFKALSFTNRREYVEWIISAKQEETKQRRLTLTIEKLSHKLKNPTAR